MLLGRYKKMTAESMNLLVGNYGRTLAKPDPELVKMALKGLNMEKPVECRPADLIPNELDKIEAELKEKLGVSTVNIDDVLTYAMFPQVALKFFETRPKGPVSFDEPAEVPKPAAAPAPASVAAASGPAVYIVNVDNRDYRVSIRDEGTVLVNAAAPVAAVAAPVAAAPAPAPAGGVTIEAPVSGTVLKFAKNHGDAVAVEDTVIVLESMKMELEIKTKAAGAITYLVETGASVAAGQVLARVQ